ncbi:DegT/DnrJ/EryC1/StrS family aminotransferase [Flavobacteriaceae bacterium]|jgi:dTDP-4-amino-4,6-dideoxygalactose transaminase|nr:DegT/DnrJ/EryC1/StrS family aminotransferase [Flavobacteriaceae bacterium]MDC1009713.1 DegT/DnrJ/EryC1/StrS family aminotransferase [Flavobacteriaceae bacterium]MDC3219254.1 DegT/DnrJ/EryC1/StrS family aminotransferase [Flavobacteriaceae bacterium]MDC3297346.1 DegT/DnrJ/EryC1/StrS family aminotransferase [Flavobacteriaceae bacterium]
MKKINMVDLNGQYRKIRWQVNREIKKVINTSSFINGPIVKDFQNNLQEYLNVRHVIPCANGTDALQIALMALDLKRGDEIITTNFSFASTIEVILLLGLKPVVIDIDPKSFNINPNLIQDKITKRTRAIIPVHLFGQSCRMEEILEIANKNNLQVIEDNAQALGSTYKFSNSQKQMSGTIGDIATTSFFPSKNLGCYGDGGAIFTNSDKLAYKMRGIVNHGMYERYYHDEIGVNSRLDSIQAAILNVKLKYLDKYNKRRQEAASLYNASFDRIDEIEVPFVESDIDSHVYHQYTLKINNGKRDELADHLQKNKIPFGIYYPLGFHEQKAYKQEFISDTDFPETNKVKDQVISLPMHTELTKKQIKFITNTIISFFE